MLADAGMSSLATRRDKRFSFKGHNVRQRRRGTSTLLLIMVGTTVASFFSLQIHGQQKQAGGRLFSAFANLDKLPGLDNSTREIFEFLARKARDPFAGGPSKTTMDLGNATVDIDLQNQKQWTLRVIENPEDGEEEEEAHLTVAGVNGELMYSFLFDTERSRYKPPPSSGMQRVALGVTSLDNGRDIDWHTTVEGHGQRIHLTSQNDTLVYDVGLHAKLNLTSALLVDYMVDAKRRPDLDGAKFNPLQKGFGVYGLKPDYTRQGGRITIKTDIGNVSIGVDQRDPDENVEGDEFLDHDLEYHLGTPLIPGLEKIELRYATENRTQAYSAKVKLDSFNGLSNSIKLGLADGQPHVDAEVGWQVPLPAGLTVSAEGKFSARDLSQGVEVSPVRLHADANFEGRLPLMRPGSGLTFGATLDPKTRMIANPHGKLQVNAGTGLANVRMKANIREDGMASGALGAGARFGDIALTYQASTERVNVTRALDAVLAEDVEKATGELFNAMYSLVQHPAIQHAMELKYSPAAQVQEVYAAARGTLSKLSGLALPQGGASVWARLTHNPKMHGGNPRLQLGIQYNLGKITTEEVTFDSENSKDVELMAKQADAMRGRLSAQAANMKDQATRYISNSNSDGPPSRGTSTATRHEMPEGVSDFFKKLRG